MGWCEYPEHAPLERMQSRPTCAARRARVRPFGRVWPPALAGILLLVCQVTSAGQDVTAPALKAAFIYQLPKFTEWPAGAIAPGIPFSICVLGDPNVADAFERMMRGRDYGGRRIALSRLGSGGPTNGCHTLYVAEGTSRVAAILAEVRERPVLTISDMEGFTELGGITQLYFDAGQLRLFIDAAAAHRAQLKISSRLMLLSKRP
jgi:hypothetical protein